MDAGGPPVYPDGSADASRVRRSIRARGRVQATQLLCKRHARCCGWRQRRYLPEKTRVPVWARPRGKQIVGLGPDFLRALMTVISQAGDSSTTRCESIGVALIVGA